MKSLPFGVLMLLSLLISAAVSFGITPIVKRMAYKVGAVDVPKDARRMHSVPIPRLGGLAIAIAFLLTVLLFAKVDDRCGASSWALWSSWSWVSWTIA